jgi:hypothetical protein
LKIPVRDPISSSSSSIKEEVEVPRIIIDDTVEVVHKSGHYSDFSGVRNTQNLQAEHFLSDDDAK